MKAWRMNGAGNAFIVIDARNAGRPLGLSEAALKQLHDVYPFDQLIGLERHDAADALLRVWNADGGEVGACGNGTRAAAALLFDAEGGSGLTFASGGGMLAARRLADGSAEVDLGPARLKWQDIPLAREMDTVRLDFAVDLPGGGRLDGPGAVDRKSVV